MKLSRAEALKIMKAFGQISGSETPGMIEFFNTTHPLPTNMLVTVKLKGVVRRLLFDDDADGDEDYLRQQISKSLDNKPVDLLMNPRDDHRTSGLAFKGKTVYLFREVNEGVRLDTLLGQQNPELTRSAWQKYIKQGRIKVNGVVQERPSFEVMPDDNVGIDRPELSNFDDQSLPIIYMDDDVIVADKPSGLLTHSKGALNDEFTVAEFFRRYTSDGLDGNRPGIVHRLDRATSGLIIGARTPEARVWLQKQFSERLVEKEYLAVVPGQLDPDEAVIDMPIGRNPQAPSTFKVLASGKSAQTRYKVEETDGERSLLLLQPTTGRTHQLRVHLNYIGHSIIGDDVYGGKPGPRLLLHARRLTIKLPSGSVEIFSSDIPAELSLGAGGS